MRKLTVVLLAVALVAVFAMTASAADITLSGQYYVKSLYEQNAALNGAAEKQDKGLALTHQRLRLQPEVAIADGLKLVMRFDALERAWGDNTWAGSSVDTASRTSQGAASVATQENIEFERAYVDFNTAIGKFMVGYQNFAAWGTAFGDTHLTRPGVKYILPIKDFVVIAAFEKGSSNYASTTKTPAMDRDQDIFDLGVVYKLDNGEAGVLYQYVRNAATRNPLLTLQHDSPAYVNALLPYYKGTFGCLYFEAEGLYAWGRGLTDKTTYFDRDAEGYGLYAHLKADLAPYYVGAMGAVMSGDDPNTAKIEGNLAKALLYGQVFAPTLIMWNDQFMTWTGEYNVNTDGTMNQYLDNAYFGYIYAGWKPTAKADVKVAYAAAKAEKTKFGQEKDYGKELDVTVTYNIYNNLQYEVGAGYFWVGDYFKGTAGGLVGNDYLLYHKLTLNF